MEEALAKLLEVQKEFTLLRQEYWVNYVLFTPKWWFLLILFVSLWTAWWIYVDKKRLKDVLIYGFFITVVVSIADELGTGYGLWEYPYLLIQVIPASFEANLGLFPVVYMLIYQKYRQWGKFLLAILIAAIVFSLAVEPLAEFLGFYKRISWRHIYSLPIYMVFPAIIKLIVDSLVKYDQFKR